MDKPVRLTLFGTPTVEHGATSLALPFERRSQLLVLLALRRGWVPRAEIAAMLWPEQESKLAFSNLRKTLFRLQSMPWAAALQSQGNSLRFEPATDVLDFEAALREQRAAEALAIYRGDLLAAFDDGQGEAWTRWLGFERERLRSAWHGAALARLEQPWDDAHGAIALASRLLEADPLDEAALRAQMQWLARAGQGGAARLAYRQFVDRLREDLGIEPGAELRALHESLAAATPAVVPPAVAVSVDFDAGFVGRAVELHRITDLLSRGECRLLCLIGPGGIGKTSLARRALRELAQRFEDGALFVDLEDTATVAQLGQRIAREAGQGRGRAGDGPLAAAIDALGSRHALLVLDNFEPLVEHASLLDRLLQACPRIKLLVTSRVRLAVAGEWSMPIEGLPFPDPEDEDRAEAFDAVQLFVRAARRMEPALMAAAEHAAIVDICRQVEGLPLAIELAAAWVRVLSCEAIAEELRRGSELLRAQDASHPARHASIEQVFEQSWRRLVPAERDVLVRLSVFRGGLTIEAARAVAAAALPVLGALADKSLLHKDGTRLRLHPLVQQLAAAKLGDDRAVAAAHAAYYLRRLAQLRLAIEDGRREALLEVDAEFENSRQAWRHAIAARDAVALAGSARSLLNYCDYRGRFEEGLALLREAIDSPLAARDAALHTLFTAQAAHLEYRLDRYAQAQADASRALASAQLPRDLAAKIQALTVLASCAMQTDRLEEARTLYRQSLELVRTEQNPHNKAATLDNLALVEKRLGHYDEALRLSLESLAQHRLLGDSAGVALCLNNLGALYKQMQDWDSAVVHWREGLAISERDGLVQTRGYLLTNLAEAALRDGNLDMAWRDAERGLEVAQATGNVGVRAWLQYLRARVALRRGDTPAAREALAQGVEVAVTHGMASLKAYGLLVFAELLEAQGRAMAARRLLAFAADHAAFNVADRDELRSEWARRAGAAQPDPAWCGPALDELLHRIVSERTRSHDGLIAELG